MVVPILLAEFEVVDEFEQTQRGEGGFGRTQEDIKSYQIPQYSLKIFCVLQFGVQLMPNT